MSLLEKQELQRILDDWQKMQQHWLNSAADVDMPEDYRKGCEHKSNVMKSVIIRISEFSRK